MQQYEPTLSLAGRLCIATVFLVAGFQKIFDEQGTQLYMATYGLTLGTMMLYLGATVIEIAGGIALVLGQTTREAAFLLVLFMLLVTGIFHTHLADTNQVLHLVKNVAIIGGLLYVGAYGSGSRSVDPRDNVWNKDESAWPYYDVLALAGRMSLGGLFLLSGVSKIVDPEGTGQDMAGAGLGPAMEWFYAGAIVVEIGGALALWLGYWTRAGAAALILFLIPTTLFFHPTSISPVLDAALQDQHIHVMKNLAILGGLLYVVAHGAGPLSLDARPSGILKGGVKHGV